MTFAGKTNMGTAYTGARIRKREEYEKRTHKLQYWNIILLAIL